MYICVCFSKTEDDIKQAILEGHNTVKKLANHLNVTNGCGSCYQEIKNIIKKSKLDKRWKWML